MSKGFGSIHAAAGMKNYLERKVKSEIERTKPGPRNATVVSIDRTRKKCEVRYPGESGTVWVPYGSVEPSGPHVKVKIDGPVGERRIVEVYGKTRGDTRLDRLESQSYSSPLWSRSIQDYAETFPLMWINPATYTPPPHNTSMAHCSPLVIPKDMHISRIEVKMRRRATNNLHISIVRLALHQVDLNDRDISSDGARGNISFNLKHISSSGDITENVRGEDNSTWRVGYTLPEPHRAYRGEVYTISYASYSNSSASARHPVFELQEHPTIPQTLGVNQFTRGWYPNGLMGGDVPRGSINTNLTRTIWAAAFPLLPGEGYVDSPGGDQED